MRYITLTLIIITACILTSCSHQMSTIGLGTGFRVGNAEWGASYGDGLFGMFVTKDGVTFKAELDSTTGLSYDPASNTYKGIKSMEYSVAPQINGYAVEFAKDNPEVARLYYEALVKYYECKQPAPALISDAKSKEASTGITDVLKKALEKFKAKGEEGASSEPFVCDGDCDLDNLDSIDTRVFQKAVADKLLTYADDKTTFEGEETTLKKSLEQFERRMSQYEAKGIAKVGLRVKRAKIRSNVLKDIRYIYYDEDGKTIETNCPECVFIPELDYNPEAAK